MNDVKLSAPANDIYKSMACPICGTTSKQKYHPFCSKRCADVDLHRWLSGNYAIPAVEHDGYDEEIE